MNKQIGFIVNPIAGMGGRVGLKGTDGVVKKAVKLGAKPVAPQKAEEMLREFCTISTSPSDLHWITCSGDMGDNELEAVGIKNKQIIYSPTENTTSVDDTKRASKVVVMEPHEIFLLSSIERSHFSVSLQE